MYNIFKVHEHDDVLLIIGKLKRKEEHVRPHKTAVRLNEFVVCFRAANCRKFKVYFTHTTYVTQNTPHSHTLLYRPLPNEPSEWYCREKIEIVKTYFIYRRVRHFK